MRCERAAKHRDGVLLQRLPVRHEHALEGDPSTRARNAAAMSRSRSSSSRAERLGPNPAGKPATLQTDRSKRLS